MTKLTFIDLQNLIYKYYFHDLREDIFRIEELLNIINSLGIKSLEEVRMCFEMYDHHVITVKLNNNRKGSITKFTDLILIAVGRDVLSKHPYCINPINDNEFWIKYYDDWFQKVENLGINPGKLIINQKKGSL